MTSADVDHVAKVHMISFKNFFLSTLGKRFLSIFYSFVLKDLSGIAIVAESTTHEIVGFVAGTTNPAGFYKRALAKNAIVLGFAAMPAILKRPAIIGRVLSALKKPIEAKKKTWRLRTNVHWCLVRNQGGGVGSLLESAFCAEAGSRGCKIVQLNTDRIGNDSVNKFYLQRGYCLHDSFVTRQGRQMNCYIKRLV